ncbi:MULTISPECIES: heat shock protein HslJ [Serratia]|uniref:heat shock protein HslJ n=1 Tax=Serratia TaxID=613 RepID=UPI0004E733EF|nr:MULTISPECIES: heat shock protein HslJ [Serratia]MDI6931869.1 heat shock protein HslJ [Serratia sp. Se-PFBMAAmG]KFF76499.1 heat-inducible protein [Serratia marcescens]MBH2761040.1 heat shock protein HslJ [Serratia marcescens]MBH2795335.1 heat shock protein HslJ [Serratia marcescens]MBH2919947.1 heat shock protein HslJ [Serratia marcescens]
MRKTTVAALTTLVLGGCSMKPQSTVTPGDLLHHNFVLQSVDGEAAQSRTDGGLLNLEFGENLHVSGAMCNRFFGQGQLRDGVLTVKPLASTRKLCPDEQRNRWDQVIGTVLENGADVMLNAQQLTLNGSGHTLVYTLRDWVY